MKKYLHYLAAGFAFLLVLSSCTKEGSEETFTQKIQIPKIISVQEFRATPVEVIKASDISKSGKIYIYKNYLLVNEPLKGIHIYNNTNPYNPVNLAFISIPGNIDMAVADNILYADSYIDLLAFDISNISSIKMVKRVESVFEQVYYNQSKNQIVVYKDTVIKATKNKGMVFDASSQSVSAFSYSSTGQGGSMARFTLMNKFLYTVGNSKMALFDVRTPASPAFVKNINLGWSIETIFPYENNLFIGSGNGMHIYNATQADNPVWLSTYTHITACDPVVVDGDYAYVTLRSNGNWCMNANNRLDVVDISNATTPKLITAYNMQNPHGLSVAGSALYLCEGNYGFKSYEISQKDKSKINITQNLKDVKAVDVIYGPKSVIVTGDDGIYQFTNTNPYFLRKMSKININPATSQNY